MDHIAWTSNLETGIPFVDSDHRVLVRLLNQVVEAGAAHEDRAVFGSVLNGLIDYTGYHFRREEALQDICGYERLLDHKAEHKELTEQVQGFRDRFLNDPGALALDELRSLLRRWLFDHILSADQDYVMTCRDCAGAVAEVSAMEVAEGIGTVNGHVDWPKLKVLVVEDNPIFGSLIRTLLMAAGVRDIRISENALEALDRIGQRAPDIVLCDVLMDDMGGEEMARRAFKIDPKTRFAFVSALRAEQIRERASSVGVDACLEKPITASGLFEAISLAVSGAVRPD